MVNRWDDLVTAESYAEHVDRWRIYRELNHRLAAVALADASVEGIRTMLDLGCGTGATLEALLGSLPMSADVLAIDSAQAMVDQGRLRLPDPRISWRVGRAEDLIGKYLSSFDLVTCGAAFWHFDQALHAPILDALKPEGWLVFNVPVAQCSGESVSAHPIQAALADLLAARRDRFPALHPRFDRLRFGRLCETKGRVCNWIPHRWEGPQGALVDLLRIPAMAELVAPGLSRLALDELVEEAAARVDADQLVGVDWWVARVGSASR